MATRRDELLVAAQAVLAEEGLGAASLRTVAARAGVTTGSVVHHFFDRETLLVAVLRGAHEAAAARMLTRAQRISRPRARLQAVLEEALPFDATRAKEWRVWLAFWAEAVRVPALAHENQRRYDEWRSFLEALVAPLVPRAAGRARAVERLITLVDGLGVRLSVSGQVPPPRAHVRQAKAQLDEAVRSLR